MMIERIAPSLLKSWLHDGQEVALLDVREHGQYGEAHLFYATPLPYSRLELDMARLVPRQSVRTVVHDSGEGVAERAAARLRALGYTRVAVLQGGVGYAQYLNHLPLELVFAHMVGTTLYTIAISHLLLTTGRPESQVSSGSTAAARNTIAR